MWEERSRGLRELEQLGEEVLGWRAVDPSAG